MSVESVIKQGVGKICDKVYLAPDIPEKKLNNAVIAITASKADPDVIIAVVDTTLLMGNAKNGFVFTGDSFFYKGMLGSSVQIKFEDIKSAEVSITTTKKDDGTVKESKKILIKGNDGKELFNETDTVNHEEFVNLINQIIEEGKNEDGVVTYENTSQLTPLSDCDSSVKLAYIELICNYALSDDGIVDSCEYAEIYSLMVRNDFNNEERIHVRAYITEDSEKESNENLISVMKENVPEGSLDVLTKSIVKDLVYINHKKGSALEEWKDNEFITTLAKLLNVSDEQIAIMVQAIRDDEDIIAKRKSDTEIQKSLKEMVAKAGAVGVPIAAVYFSGSVVGLSAAGITSGLATLGMGGVLGFSSMVTGIGAAVLIGFVAYNGIKKVTGAKDLENNKQRELMIQTVIKNLQKTINYLIEDVNYISSELMQAIENQIADEAKISKLKKLLQTFIDASNISSQNLLVNAKEAMIVKLPAKLDKMRFDELTSEPTKQKLRQFVYEMYKETVETSNNGECEKTVYLLDYSKTIEYYEKLYQVLDALNYFKLSTAITAAGLSIAKKGLSSLKGTLGV